MRRADKLLEKVIRNPPHTTFGWCIKKKILNALYSLTYNKTRMKKLISGLKVTKVRPHAMDPTEKNCPGTI